MHGLNIAPPPPRAGGGGGGTLLIRDLNIAPPPPRGGGGGGRRSTPFLSCCMSTETVWFIRDGERMGQWMRAQAHPPVHTAPGLWGSSHCGREVKDSMACW